MIPKTGSVAGYDPGGNGKHGVSLIRVCDGAVAKVGVQTLNTAEDVLVWIESLDDLLCIGVDTLCYWCTGRSGWRGADLWLRKEYPEVRGSVVSPNSLYGSMGLNGMSVIYCLRLRYPELPVTETHPKVLHWALTGCKHNHPETSAKMNAALGSLLGIRVETANDHEWDACISALAAFKGVMGHWEHDLMTEGSGTGRLVQPAGLVHYWWPE